MRGGVALAGAALFALLVLGSSTTFEEDLDAPADVAWSHPMGDPPNGTPPPRPRVPCIDDGPAAGAPLGGMGAGSVGRTYRGDFARWHLRVGAHVHRPAEHTFAAVRVDGRATVLSSLPAHARVDPVPPGDDSPGANPAPAPDPDPTPPRARRILPADGSGGVYRALYPRAWYEYDPAALSPDADVRVAQTQFSPILPGRYRESSLPVGILRFVAQNDGDRTREVSIMLSFQNPLATVDVAPVDTRGPRETWRVPADARFRHADFVLRRGDARARGVHMHAQGVVDGTLEPTRAWHGGFAIAVEDASSESRSRSNASSSPRVVVSTASYDPANASDAWRQWDAFERTGALDDDERGRETPPTSAAAVCVTFRLAPGERVSTRFALAWDLPVAEFPKPEDGDGARTAFAKRYTRYHPHGADGEGTDDAPRIGAAAPELAAEALRRADEWEADISRWQRPYVRSARRERERGDGDELRRGTDTDERDSLRRGTDTDERDSSPPTRISVDASRPPGLDPGLDVSRPAWFVSALFNELHHLVDGGTIWGRPLTKSGLTDATRDFVPAARVDGDGGDAGEDGEGGDANDVVGNGGAWGGSLGRFATLQNHDQALYAAAPSYFYGSWGLAALWPGLDLALVADLAAAATASDDAERPIAWARARDGASTTARKRRKVRGAAAHDLGAPRAAPLTSSPNAHDVTDVNGWKDLAPQLMLLVARAHAFRGGFSGADNPGGVPSRVLARLFEPAYFALGNALRYHDADGDGAVEHERDPDTWGADHGFDRWPAAPGANTAYCGGLWLAALRVGAGMARDLNQTTARRSMATILASAAAAHDEKLWVWSDPERGRDVSRRREDGAAEYPSDGYYRFDSSGTRDGNASMATQVAGEWFLASIGAPGVLPAEKVRAALRAAYRLNVRGFARASERERAKDAKDAATESERDGTPVFGTGTVPEETVSGMTPSFGAVNGATPPNGDVLDTNVHASEAWAGPTYALAAHMLLVGLDDEAWDTAGGAYRATWEGGLGFRTPEAWDARGRFRHAMDGKAGAAWALEHALRVRAARRGGTGSRHARRDGFPPRETHPRDEL